MKTIHIERLRTLYSIMAGVPSEKVDLRTWRHSMQGEWRSSEALMSGCGTTGCAVGWACAYPEFVKAGLSFDIACGVPVFKSGSVEQRNWDAVEKFFGIEETEASTLFAPFHWHQDSVDLMFESRLKDFGVQLGGREMVMRRIRRFLAHKGAISWERNEQLASQEGVPA